VVHNTARRSKVEAFYSKLVVSQEAIGNSLSGDSQRGWDAK
jgi:hypothetical protein